MGFKLHACHEALFQTHNYIMYIKDKFTLSLTNVTGFILKIFAADHSFALDNALHH